MSGYALHPGALADLEEIRSYIAHDNPDVADRVMTEMFDEFRMLTRFPDLGFPTVRSDSPANPFSNCA
jgi:plasmid stabilization system protein ParE